MKWFRNLIKGLSLTGALFVFQACYGTPQSYFSEHGQAPMSFTLVSKNTGKPLEGIVIKSAAVSGSDNQELGVTDTDGKCSVEIFYMKDVEGPFLSFEDPEGKYMAKDTLLTDLRERDIVISLASK
mgnify:CR=1 FL=1